MPIALLFIAILVIITGIKGNYSQVGQQFSTDVMGTGGFLQFLVGIFGIAIFFRMIGMPNAGRAFISLVIVVFLLQNSNVLTTLENVVGTSGNATSSANASAK